MNPAWIESPLRHKVVCGDIGNPGVNRNVRNGLTQTGLVSAACVAVKGENLPMFELLKHSARRTFAY